MTKILKNVSEIELLLNCVIENNNNLQPVKYLLEHNSGGWISDKF